MDKKVMFYFFAVLLLVFTLSNALALDENSTAEQRVDLAYDCVENLIGNKTCEQATTPEKIFALLSVSECRKELISDSNDNKCWPASRCDIKTTAQAILALDHANEETDLAQEWLLEQKQVPTDLVWYLEIESMNETSCEITYDEKTYTTDILENKKIDRDVGSCLSISENGYWLKINPSCYEQEFEITCEDSFLSTLLFKEQDSTTIHVLDKVHSAPDYGTTIEKINSFCFAGSAGCNYEGTLWASIVLDKLGQDVSAYIPYLVTGAQDNREKFPSPFIYLLTGYLDYKTDILSRQIAKKYWKFENGKYFDTALALLPFYNDDFEQKDFAIEWLFDIQQEDGCFARDNIVDNGFLLYSIWPRGYYGSGSEDIIDDDDNATSDNDCELSNYYCVSSMDCATGNVLSSYACNGMLKCCAVEPEQELCSDLDGEICSEKQYCKGGSEKITSDADSFGETCCVGGVCTEKKPSPGEEEGKDEPTNQCENNFGTCEPIQCGSGYEQSLDYSCGGTDICCMKKDGKSLWWIWLLLVLIILIVIAVIYREKIMEFYKKITSKEDSSKGPSGGMPPRRPGMPPSMMRSTMSQRRPMPPVNRVSRPMPSNAPRKIIPSGKKPESPERQIMPTRPINPKPAQKSPKELDDVLKKLKEMSD